MIKFLLLLCTIFTGVNLFAQERITTQKSPGVEALVKNSLIKGNCRNVSNISFIGNDSISIGQFGNAENIIGISEGIIISTGDFELAQGPNISSEASYALDNLSSDVDLGITATSTLFDVTAIEFDFVPLSDNVTFNYVFASEEYCEFVGTSFNDVFGFIGMNDQKRNSFFYCKP